MPARQGNCMPGHSKFCGVQVCYHRSEVLQYVPCIDIQGQCIKVHVCLVRQGVRLAAATDLSAWLLPAAALVCHMQRHPKQRTTVHAVSVPADMARGNPVPGLHCGASVRGARYACKCTGLNTTVYAAQGCHGIPATVVWLSVCASIPYSCRSSGESQQSSVLCRLLLLTPFLRLASTLLPVINMLVEP